ncbi:pseudaminic acid synthase [Fontisubflavum oceani]|uniref:pseudaminic acid synthase n=1 Tax=Fontisubflavum oceani TaxID=2978973 RepID=UPI0025B50BF5|nr:pseudaminic acid synthase [Fontisubflavum oceani]WJY21201.1 pseudaminic acid synthase [Fontisubflavum oceani]
MIAEVSANHNGSLEAALRLITEARRAGADAVKIQTYRPDTITLDRSTPDFVIQGGLWDGHRLFDLYEQAQTPWDWHPHLFEHARSEGITLFSSPFDTTAIDFLDELGTPAFKIASFEAVDLPLIRYAASKGKPLIISTGMADAEEIGEAVTAAREAGCLELALLHCVSGYPAPATDFNLATIPDMRERFGTVVGLSDHSLENTTAISAVSLGAALIEKHVTLDRAGGGPDDSFSLEPTELASLTAAARIAWSSLGHIDYGRKSSEQGNVQFRRSLYFVTDLPEGSEITAEALRSVRPGHGLPPKFFDAIVGRRLIRPAKDGTPVTWDHVGGP